MKKLIPLLLIPLYIFGNCNYKMDIEIFPKKHKFIANADIDGKQSSIKKVLSRYITDEFIYIEFPKAPTLCLYDINLTIPKEFIAITEAETINRVERGGKALYSFKISKPIESINIIASTKFVVNSQKYKDILISTYFFKEHKDLSDRYISKVKEYIDMYEEIIAEFPYKRFSVVENKFQTGYSMPTYTLIGSRIIDKPFLTDISLGHEIVHQWFGNSVFNNFKSGNWVEGLTTYLSDHYYKELDKKGWEYRKGVLSDYEAYINEKNIISLSEFTQRIDRSTMTIGYGKGAYAFVYLKRELGEEVFYKKLKEFYREFKWKYATYQDIGEFFGKSETIHNIFEHMDIVSFNPTNLSVGYDNGVYRVEFTIAHDKNISHGYNLPILVESSESNKSFNFYVDGNTTISIEVEDRPINLIFDRDYELFRELKIDEITPTISKLLGDNELLIVTQNSDEFNILKTLFDGAKRVDIDKLTFKDLESRNVLFLQDAKELALKSMPNLESVEQGLMIELELNPWNHRKVVSYLESSSIEELKKAYIKIARYSKYSKLIFLDSKLVQKEIKEANRGAYFKIARSKSAIKVPKAESLKDIIDEIEDKKVIYIGESHTNYAHHINQLEIIKSLHKRGNIVAIGMEMFQRDFQSAIDDYLAGKIDKKSFLKRSQYFTRWKYNYNLYSPIIEYAKDNSIPIIALNIRKEVIKKVTKGGIYSLSKEDREALPKKLDFTNISYREYLKNFFNSDIHSNAMGDENSTEKPDSNFVYQSQIVWDEIMAEGVVEYIESNSVDNFIVIAGNGHLKDSYGIPDRVKRELNISSALILQDISPTPGSADYVLYPSMMEVKEPLKIGVFLDTKDGLKVTKIMPDSIAKERGVKKGDIIVGIDQEEVEDLDELKFILFFKDRDDKFKIKVKRGKDYLFL